MLEMSPTTEAFLYSIGLLRGIQSSYHYHNEAMWAVEYNADFRSGLKYINRGSSAVDELTFNDLRKMRNFLNKGWSS